jgi:hypothetical protein
MNSANMTVCYYETRVISCSDPTFGLIGVFLGPALLGIGFNLAKEWTQAD